MWKDVSYNLGWKAVLEEDVLGEPTFVYFCPVCLGDLLQDTNITSGKMGEMLRKTLSLVLLLLRKKNRGRASLERSFLGSLRS